MKATPGDALPALPEPWCAGLSNAYWPAQTYDINLYTAEQMREHVLVVLRSLGRQGDGHNADWCAGWNACLVAHARAPAAPSVAASSPMSDLQHDIERHVQIASNLATENAMLVEALRKIVRSPIDDGNHFTAHHLASIARAALAAAGQEQS